MMSVYTFFFEYLEFLLQERVKQELSEMSFLILL